jgi:putative membrane protein
MTHILVSWIVTTLAILVVTHVIPGVRVSSLGTAVVAAAILGILNALVRPILVLLTLPLTIVTLGLFLFVINALMFQLAGALVSGFHVDSFWSALLGSLIVSIISYIVLSVRI